MRDFDKSTITRRLDETTTTPLTNYENAQNELSQFYSTKNPEHTCK